MTVAVSHLALGIMWDNTQWIVVVYSYRHTGYTLGTPSLTATFTLGILLYLTATIIHITASYCATSHLVHTGYSGLNLHKGC